MPTEDIIDISSDEDDDLQPPQKKVFTRRGNSPSTNESDFIKQLSQKDQEIERLKKVRTNDLCVAISTQFGVAQRDKELEQVIKKQKKEMDAKASHGIPVRSIPFSTCVPWLTHPQRVDEIEEELTCDICAIRMWAPYRWVSPHPAHSNDPLTQI